MGERIEVTGCASRFPMVDRHGRRLEVGDVLLAQVCVGRYGAVKQFRVTVKDAHYPLGFIDAQDGLVNFQYDAGTNTLRGYLQHRDFEHGHEQWAEVVERAGAVL